MKIYLIQGNNNEAYDQYYEWIEGIYLAKENAKKELKKLKTKARKDYKKNQFFAERQYKIITLTTKD
jgi:N-acetylneuraminic acid mutarotase